jgi:dihydroorotate dehydrogenase electron transfer subunit
MAQAPAPLDPLRPALPRDERAKVLEVFDLGADDFILSLESPYIARNARPGQFAMLRAGDGFSPLTRRPISFWNAQEEDGRVEFLISAIGPATRLFQRAKPGQTLDVLGTLGRGFDLDFPESVRRVVIVGGSSGVAPFYFAARVIKESSALSVHLFYGCSTRSHVHLDEFARLGLDLHPVTEDGTLGERGLVTEPFEKFIDRYGEECSVLSCGSTPMMQAVDDLCRKRRIPVQYMLGDYMGCGIGVCLSCVMKAPDGRYILACRDGAVLRGGEFLWE